MRVKLPLVFKVTSRYIIRHTNIKTGIVIVRHDIHRVLTHTLMILDLSLALKMTIARHSESFGTRRTGSAKNRSFALTQDDHCTSF